MKYLLLLGAPREAIEPGTPEAAQLFAAYQAVTSEMAEAGVLVHSAPLQPEEATTTVRIREGETLVTDGPAAEIKEHLGGFTLIECADLDEALRWAARIPAAADTAVEVHPVVPVAGGS